MSHPTGKEAPPYPTGEYPPAGGYPPPGGYPQGGYPATSTAYATGPGQTTVVVQSAGVYSFGETPTRVKCQHCSQEITTQTMYDTGMMTWVAAGIICIVGCFLGCCLIPFCIDACKDVVHTCPNCHQVVGRYKRLS